MRCWEYPMECDCGRATQTMAHLTTWVRKARFFVYHFNYYSIFASRVSSSLQKKTRTIGLCAFALGTTFVFFLISLIRSWIRTEFFKFGLEVLEIEINWKQRIQRNKKSFIHLRTYIIQIRNWQLNRNTYLLYLKNHSIFHTHSWKQFQYLGSKLTEINSSSN